jgi:hypothetical protein
VATNRIGKIHSCITRQSSLTVRHRSPLRHWPIANRGGAEPEAVTVAIVTVLAKFARKACGGAHEHAPTLAPQNRL